MRSCARVAFSARCGHSARPRQRLVATRNRVPDPAASLSQGSPFPALAEFRSARMQRSPTRRSTVDRVVQRKVVRVHLRSTVEGVDWVAIEEWCLRGGGKGWIGVGWGLWDESCNDISWPEYGEHQREAGRGVDDSVRRLHELPQGALVWTRRLDSSYWRGEIVGPWRYRDGATAQRLDMFNVRPCYWWHVGTQDSVPGIVVSNFNRRKALNPVANPGAPTPTGSTPNSPATLPRSNPPTHATSSSHYSARLI
jgi:hypothetical protein